MNKNLLLLLIFFALSIHLKAENNIDIPFSTDESHLTIWNGETYKPVFIKGINLGVAVPGTFPGELAAQKEDYVRWFEMIKVAGYNTIRLYTLHFPRFYEALLEYNNAHPQDPLLFFQGIWLEEEIPNYDGDLYSLTDVFKQEIRDNINCVHGNNDIAQRFGKAYGIFNSDVSQYMLGYIIGREIYPSEVLTSDSRHSENTSYEGEFLSISNAKPSAFWMTEKLDFLITYESDNYNTQRPVAFSSWPTLDPLSHPNEQNREEDTASIDLSRLDYSRAAAGYFVSYHAYPYYPDFISRDPNYQDEDDYLGQNSYLAYLKDLRSYYDGIPLLIAEFGASSSWGIAHYAQNGIHHGGSSELQQGKDCLRMFRNLQTANTAGGIQFSWIDEWFKRTWISDPMDAIADRRILWHNLTSAEQNFGLVGFQKNTDTLQYSEVLNSNNFITEIEASADYSFLNINLKSQGLMGPFDTLWLALDTYGDTLGELLMPNGDTIPHRSEFLLQILNDRAELYVTEAYDLYGIWHNISDPGQLFRSVASENSAWNLVRWKNNNTEQEVQYIGIFGVNRLNTPLKSTDAVILDSNEIKIRLPWTLINVTDPSEMTVMNDDRNTPQREYATSSGIGFSVFYKNEKSSNSNKFSWAEWQLANDYTEYKKESYNVISNELINIQSLPLARTDSFDLSSEEINEIDLEEGLLSNDWSLGTGNLSTYISTSPNNGLLFLNPDGSFSYQAFNGFVGVDSFRYILSSESGVSETASVYLNIEGDEIIDEDEGFVKIYPNPGSGIFQIQSSAAMKRVEVYNSRGQFILRQYPNSKQTEINISNELPNFYILRVFSKNDIICKKLVIQN